MDENQAPTAPRNDPFRRLLQRDGDWEQAGGARLSHVQTGEAFGRLALPAGEDAQRWAELIDALADLDSERLVLPRAVIDDGAGVLYAEPDEPGWSFAHLLETEGSADQRETMRMAGDLAGALADLHGSGAVLGRLRLQDVLRAPDGGWLLLVSPSSGARLPATAELARLRQADLMLLAAAAVTVLTGRRPSAQPHRPSLLSTHPQLDPRAADALERVLDGAALSASELQTLLDPDEGSAAAEPDASETHSTHEDDPTEELLAWSQDDPEAPAEPPRAGSFPGSAVVRAGGSGRFEPDPQDSDLLRRRGARSSALGQHSAVRRPARPDARHSRWVLVGAAVVVLGAAALSGWQLVAGAQGEGESQASAAQETGAEESSAQESSVPEAAAGASAGSEAAVPDPAAAEPGERGAESSGAASTEPDDQSPSEAGQPSSRPPSTPAPETDDDSAAGEAVSSQHSPEYAAAALIARRAEALRTGDRQLLASLYEPGAADLTDDLETLERAEGTDAFGDLEMTLADAVPLTGPEDAPAQHTGASAEGTASQRTAVVLGTVEATGRDLGPQQEGVATVSQDLQIRLVADDSGAWRIVDVTPR